MKIKKVIFILLSIVGVAVLSGCASKKQSLDDMEAQELASSAKIEIVEHKGSALEMNRLPVWMQVYVERGIPGLEQLADYDGRYCFIGERSGATLNPLITWENSYNVAQDIASSVSNSVNAKFTGSETGSPDANYGSYYETVVTTTANATYSGAHKVNDWWIKTSRADPNNKKNKIEQYTYYVLYTIDKQTLDRQVLNAINQVAVAGTTEQQRAIDNVKAAMEREGLR
jgi:hypothetical protein